jgi:HEAT repeat protein
MDADMHISMSSRLPLALLLAALIAAGCGSRTETPLPKAADPVVEKTSTEPSAAPPKNDLPKAKPEIPPPESTSTQAEPKPSGDWGVRGLVQKLARKEGSKWTIDEKAKAELEKLGPQAVDQLLPLMDDESADVRRGAAYQLLPLAASRDELAQAFAKLLDDSDPTIRGIGLSAVGQFKPAQKAAAAPALAKVLHRTDADEQQRAAAARLLGDLGAEAAALLPQLSKAAGDDASAKVRSSALLALSRIAEPAATVEAATKALGDQDQGVRLMAVQRLRELGRAAEPALDDLAKLLEDKDEKTRRTAGEALVRIGGKSLPALTAALDSSSRDAREVALTALGKMGPLAKPALPAVRKRLSDSDPIVKELAKRTVREIESQ